MRYARRLSLHVGTCLNVSKNTHNIQTAFVGVLSTKTSRFATAMTTYDCLIVCARIICLHDLYNVPQSVADLSTLGFPFIKVVVLVYFPPNYVYYMCLGCGQNELHI